jgi:hypothetical protein
LVLRIQEQEFAKLPFEERQQALQTLSRLRPKRCAEVCMALLSDARVLRLGAHEETRELAAQFLAEVAASDPAFFLLEDIAKSSAWRNSKRVRESASAALERLKQRALEAEQRKAERKSTDTASAVNMKSEAKKRRSTTTQAPEPAAVSGSVAGRTAPLATASEAAAKAPSVSTASGATKPSSLAAKGARTPSVSNAAQTSRTATTGAARPAAPAATSSGTGRVTKPGAGEHGEAEATPDKQARGQT